jgi:hypothetical protein
MKSFNKASVWALEVDAPSAVFYISRDVEQSFEAKSRNCKTLPATPSATTASIA